MKSVQWIMRMVLCLGCVLLLAIGLVAQEQAPPEKTPDQQLSNDQLATLVAPIALYPDSLLSQVLVAATYPLEIVEAGQWLEKNRNLQGKDLVEAALQQNWDPSIQALVAFPDVIERLNADIRWTTDLGNAFLSQQPDVMNAVQRLRIQAKSNGKLESSPKETVTTEQQGDKSVVVIKPADPEVVYVPYYNPEYIWGPPLYGYYAGWNYPFYGFGFGPGIYIGGFFGGLGWGGWGWGMNWYGCSIMQNPYFFNHYGYYSHGYHGYGAWSHDPVHRMGVQYSNATLNQRYGVATMARGQSRGMQYGGPQQNSAPRANMSQADGWSRFSHAGTTSQVTQRGYASPSDNSRSSANRSTPSSGGNHSAPSYHSAPSSGGGQSARSASSGGSHSGGGSSGGGRGRR
jgi:uncharacterized membrane protein YgcG